MTKLEFLRDHDIKPAALARETGCSRQKLACLCAGRSRPHTITMRVIAAACSKLTGAAITVADLFE